MKQIFIAILFLSALKSNAQDSTKIKGLQMQSKVIEYLIPMCMNPDNDSLYQVYQDLRPKYRNANPPSNNTLVTIDSIPTIELAKLYNNSLMDAAGLGMSNNIKSAIASVRLTNSYLDTLCTFWENYWGNKLLDIRSTGRKLLRGK